MIIRCTDHPSIEQDGEDFVASIPSGGDVVQISFNRHNTYALMESGRRALARLEAMGPIAKPFAELIPFKKARRKRAQTRSAQQ